LTFWKKLTSIFSNKPEGGEQAPPPRHPEPPPPARRTDEPIPGDAEFAVALYGVLRRTAGNMVFSPLALRATLAMLRAGARDRTAMEMDAALRFPSGTEDMHARFGAVFDAVKAAVGEKVRAAVACSIWRQEGSPFSPGFQKIVRMHYENPIYNVNFLGAPEKAREWIDRWAEDRTRGGIRSIVPAGEPDRGSRLVLANACFFRGEWATPFERKATVPLPFHPTISHEIRTPMMYQDNPLPWAESDDALALEIPFAGGDFGMAFVLPRARWNLPFLEKKLTSDRLTGLFAAMKEAEVRVYLPKFRVEWRMPDPVEALEELGIRDAFHRSYADFSGINGFRPPHEDALHIGRIFHSAAVEAEDEGPDAAPRPAADDADVWTRLYDAPGKARIFRADHPFMFAIRHRPSGTILFIGRIQDPSSG
jgi:serpin B